MNIYDFLRMQGRLPPAPRLAPLASQLPGAPTGPPRGLSAQGGFMGGVDRLLGGAGMAGLDPANAADARRQGLLAAGAQMMMASQPQFGPPQTLTGILAQGLMAGQQGYGQGMDQGYAAQDMARKQAIYAELQPKPGESIPQTYARVQAMFAAATAQGDTDIARASSEVLKSMAGMMESKAAPKAPDLWVGPDGQAYQRVEPTKDNPFGLVPTGIKRPESEGRSPAMQLLEDQRAFTRENQLNDDYNAEIKPITDVYGMISGALDSTEAAKAGDGPAQVQLLYAFVKAMDASSAVREGELTLVQGAGSLKQRAQGLLDKYGKGEAVVVPAPMVDDIARVLRQGATRYERIWQGANERYKSRAERWKVDPSVFRPAPNVFYQDPAAVAAKYGGNAK